MLDKQRLRTFLLGGAAGALVGILVAPRSGKELRGSLANRAGEARERSREGYFEAQERMRERFSETRETPRRRADAEQVVTVGPAEDAPNRPRPPLRDVTFETADEEVPGAGPDELRRRIKEARERLKDRMDAGERSETERDE